MILCVELRLESSPGQFSFLNMIISLSLNYNKYVQLWNHQSICDKIVTICKKNIFVPVMFAG